MDFTRINMAIAGLFLVGYSCVNLSKYDNPSINLSSLSNNVERVQHYDLEQRLEDHNRRDEFYSYLHQFCLGMFVYHVSLIPLRRKSREKDS